MKLLLLTLALTLPLAACSGDDANPTPAETASATEADLPLVTVYKSPTCGCCAKWADHIEAAGFPVKTVDVTDLGAVKAEHGIPAQYGSCHTAVVDGYAVEGHVPAEDVKRLLAERPEAAGLAVPGMPIGSPGMETPGRRADRYEVLLVQDGDATVFTRH
ncbi:MAG: DUF411 domain-containing protein [Rhodothermales bacterium]|jgi:hypothetical protein